MRIRQDWLEGHEKKDDNDKESEKQRVTKMYVGLRSILIQVRQGKWTR